MIVWLKTCFVCLKIGLAEFVCLKTWFVCICAASECPSLRQNIICWWLFEGVMGTVMGAGKNHFNYKISESHFKENELGIKAELMKCFLNRGWDVNITTLLLPPTRGNQNPSNHVQLTRDALPVFMVFRVQLGRKHWRFGSFCSDTMESMQTCL